MSSPLMFAAFQALEEFTSWYLYSHIIHFSPEKNRWFALEKRSWRLLPFYFTLSFIFIGFGAVSCITVVFKYVFTKDPTISGLVFGFTFFLVACSLNELCINVPAINHAHEMVEYINAVVDLEEIIFPHESSKPNLGKGLTCIKSILQLLHIQGKNFFHRNKLDYMGILQMILALPMQVIFCVAPFVGVYFGFDPFRFGFIALGFAEKPSHPPVIILFRLVMIWVCCMDTCRTLALVVNPLLMEHCVYNKIIKFLHKRQPSRDSLRLYNSCLIVQYAGEPLVAHAITILFGSGFVMAVLLTFTVCLGWKLLPFPLYLCSIPAIIGVLGCFHIMFPIVLDSHDRSIHMLRIEWPVKLAKNGGLGYSRAVIRRMIRAARPIVFKSSWLHRPVNQETRRTYNAQIMFKTIDVLLLSESQV